MTVHVAGSDPYPWPYDGRLDGPHLALLLAGWDAEWSERSIGADLAGHRCAELAAAVERRGGIVITIAHGGAVPIPIEADGPAVVTAFGIDGFFDGPLDSFLRSHGRTHLLVAGHGIEGPVHSTLRSANDRGYECLLVTDACSSLTYDLAVASAKTVTMSGGIFGALGTVDAVLDALQTDPVPVPVPVTAQEA